jgi:hypothetical protein
MAIEVRSQTDVPVVPAWIIDEDCAKQYRLGTAWYQCSGDERIPGPLTEQYLLDSLKWMSEKGLFSGAHDTWALSHLGFMLGMLSQEQ